MAEMFDRSGRTLVVGLGETGVSVARYLSRQGVPVAVVDSRDQPPGLARMRSGELADVALFLGGFSDEAFDRAEQIVLSPGVPLSEPHVAAAQARGVPVIGDIELFAQAAQAPVIAVTGSNGKSTVVTLLGAMARRAGIEVRTGGNLGTPALDLLEETEPALYVLELSSFQLETVHSLHLQAAAILNISEDHMDRYTSLADYAAAKQVVYRCADLQVVNADDPVVLALADPSRPQLRFTRNAPAAGEYGLVQLDGVTWLARGSERLLPATAMRLAGRHNLVNALAALALGEAAGLSLDAMLETLAEFQGLPHRMQFVGEHAGVRWYNDSKGTNVGATLAAIDGLEGPLVLVAGGDGKGADFAPLVAALRAKGRGVVLIGRDAPRLEALLAGVLPIRHATDMAGVVRAAAALAVSGDTVLLSPACASTDMFRNYSERGELFMRAVQEYIG
ncbi:MAG: UDP-N-acetylmuramoyl-L-alanine--D-glutamate ligase [Pseudomonadota bacterium]